MEVIALTLGGMSIILGAIAIVQAHQFNKSTEKLIQSEDLRVKQMIAEWRQQHEENMKEFQRNMNELRQEHRDNVRQFQEMMTEWRREAQESERRFQETLRYIANLISKKSDEVKELIQEKL